jgi:hypothetical protein
VRLVSFTSPQTRQFHRRHVEALESRRRGRGESGVDRARRTNDFLLHRREATFPFSSTGADSAAAAFFEAFAVQASTLTHLRGRNCESLMRPPYVRYCLSGLSRPAALRHQKKNRFRPFACSVTGQLAVFQVAVIRRAVLLPVFHQP